MKNLVKSISRLLILLVIAACSTTGTIKNKQLSKTDDSYITLAKELTAAPKNPELTADVKIKIGMGSYDATLMMRWNESIRISVTPLGIMEIMRLECLPDMIVFVDRTSSRYAVEHYADVPYRNITGLDFYSLQALLWNKIFVPGYTDIESVVQRIKLSEMGEHGTLFSSTEYDYNFTVDKSGKLVQTSKESLVYSVAANYLDFKPVADGVIFPHKVALEMHFAGNARTIEILLDDISVENSDWPNRVPISTKYQRCSIKEILDKFSL